MPDYSDKTPKDVPQAIIEWSDYTDVENWNEDEDIEDTQLWSVCWVLEDNEKHIVISRDYDWTNSKWATLRVLPKMTPYRLCDLKVVLSPCPEEDDKAEDDQGEASD